MPEAKDFELGHILSVTTGRLFSRTKPPISGVYEILNYMTGVDLFTHQLPRASEECRPALLVQHPQLGEIEVPEFESTDIVWSWLDEQESRYGKTLPVKPLAKGEHRSIHPVEELADLVGTEKIIVVDPANPEQAVEEIRRLTANNP